MANELQTKLDEILLDKNTNLLPEHLKAGVTCLGVEGNMESGIDTSDATATSADLINPKTAYVNGEKVVGNINKSTADTIIGTSDNTVEEFRTNILNALSGHMNADESGINYDLYPQKYGTGDTSLDKPVNIYFVYENLEENCYDMIAIRTGNWNIKRNSNAGWNASVSRSEHYVTTTNGTDWRNGVDFYHYRINYNFEFVSRVTKSKEKTAVWGNQSMNTLFSINSCLYENLLLVSPNYLSRMISNVSSFAVYKDRAGKSSYPSLNEELNLILNEKNTKIIPENIKKDVTILNVTGILEQGVDTSDATATQNDIIRPKTAYVNGEKITGNIAYVGDTGTNMELANRIILDLGNPETMENDCIGFQCNTRPEKMALGTTSYNRVYTTHAELADVLELTSDKIVSGNTILGVVGNGVGSSPSMIEDPMLNANGITYQNYPKLLEQDCITLTSDDGMTELYAKITSLYYDTDLRLQLLVVSSMESSNYVYYNMGNNSWINFYDSTENLIGSYEINNIYIMPDTRTNTIELAYGGSMLGDDVASYTITTTQQT